MKLIVTIVDDKDVDKVMTALTRQRIRVTQVSNTGGLLGEGNATLLIGIDEERVPETMKVIADLASSRQSFIPYTYQGDPNLTGIAEVQVGGFQTFVLDVDHFEQV